MVINKKTLKEEDIVKISIKKITTNGIETDIKYSRVGKNGKDIILDSIKNTLLESLTTGCSWTNYALFDEDIEVLEIITEKQQIEYLKHYIQKKDTDNIKNSNVYNPYESYITSNMFNLSKPKEEEKEEEKKEDVMHINNTLLFLSFMSICSYAGILLLLLLNK